MAAERRHGEGCRQMTEWIWQFAADYPTVMVAALFWVQGYIMGKLV